MPEAKSKFLEYVQLHERSWGIKTYPGRPTLEQFLASPVVVFWKATNTKTIEDQPVITATLYDDLRGVEDYFIKLVFRAQIEPPKVRLSQVFSNKKSVKIRGVRIMFEEENGSP
ncbi:MAG: hypothetical protein R3E39_20475 [Anaerolineae bacterium]